MDQSPRRRLRPLPSSPSASWMALSALAALAALCVVLLGAFGGRGGGTGAGDTAADIGSKAAKQVKAAKPESVEQIAATIGCKAEITVDAEELRQGNCKAGEARYVIVTFTAAKGQHDWLTEAKPYGGIYLVGNRWTITGPPQDTLQTLRAELGGNIELGDNHAAHTG